MTKIKAGDTMTFYGCCWDAEWEFDMPCVIYYPFKAYSPNGSGVGYIEDFVDDICCDLLCDQEFSNKWDDSDLKEFKWRGWNPDGFGKRCDAIHQKIVVEFCHIKGWRDLEFKVLSIEEKDGPFENWGPGKFSISDLK